MNMLTLKQRLTISTVTTLILTISGRVDAATLITQRSALGGNDSVDWSNVGKVFNPFAPNFADFLPNSFSTNSSAGLGVNVNIPPASIPGITPPFVFQTSSQGIRSNFGEGDYILFTGFIPGGFPAIGNSNPLTINFDLPVKAAGTQLTVDDVPKYTIWIEAFDPQNISLGLFSILGNSSETLDNSAQFVGVKSESANIKKLVYSYTNPGLEKTAFGINFLELENASIPEPSSIFGLLTFGFLSSILKFIHKDRTNK